MRLRDTVQSKWFKVDDLPGRQNGELIVTIKGFGMSKFSDGRESLDLVFHEHPKPLGCNTTNKKRLMLIFGEDVELDDLVGQRIRLYAEATQDLRGVPCWGVRIGACENTIQAATMKARERIDAALARDDAPPSAPRRAAPAPTMANAPRATNRPASAPVGRIYQDSGPPPGFYDPEDPGPAFDSGAGF